MAKKSQLNPLNRNPKHFNPYFY